MEQQIAQAPVVGAPAAAPEQRLKMSYDEYLVWSDERRGEWVDGEVVVFMPPMIVHQRIVGFLSALLLLYANLFKLGEVLVAPCEMRAEPGGAAREPDLLFVAAAHQERLTARRLAGPADLVVEVISDESAARDRADKFYEYQAAGVAEYWLIDPRAGKQRVDLYRLTPEGQYIAILPDAEGRYHARVLPGLWFDPRWLWQEPLPDPLVALAEIRGLTPEVAQALRALLAGEQTPGAASTHEK